MSAKSSTRYLNVNRRGITDEILTAYCPHCRRSLEKPPSKKSKCPFCSKSIFVRKKQILFNSFFLTEQEAQAVDWFNQISVYGFTSEDFVKKQNELAKKFQHSPPPLDIIWGLFNLAIVKNCNDPSILSLINYQMAMFLDDEGKNPFECLYESKKMQLIHFKEMGARKVKVLCIKDRSTCVYCEGVDGKIFPINTALELMPIPPKNCSFCRCRYLGADSVSPDK